MQAILAAWDIDPSRFPVTGTAIDKARFAVGYAILAPSSLILAYDMAISVFLD